MRLLSTILGLLAAFTAVPALAQSVETVGKPTPRGVGFQPAATELARQLQSLDQMLLIIITATTGAPTPTRPRSHITRRWKSPGRWDRS